MKFLKPIIADGKVIAIEMQKIKQTGHPPCGRTCHTMAYLPNNQCLIIVGGRNDEMCKSLVNPFLNDMFLYLLD